MFSFGKVETSDNPANETGIPEMNTMDRGEDAPLTVSDITAEINPIDYDTEDEFDEEPFEPRVPVVGRRDTVFELEVENKVKEENLNDEECPLTPEEPVSLEPEVKIEVIIEESFIARLCRLLSSCFKRSRSV